MHGARVLREAADEPDAGAAYLERQRLVRVDLCSQNANTSLWTTRLRWGFWNRVTAC
jgi:hypothetical protein